MKIDLHHFHHPDAATAEELRRIGRLTRHIMQNMENNMVDTSKLLEAVEKQRTESASLLELARAQHSALVEIKGKLADAVSKLDAQAAEQAGLQQVQADIDKAVNDLNADDSDVQAAVQANVEQNTDGGEAGQQASGAGSGQPLAGTASGQPADQGQSTDQPKDPS